MRTATGETGTSADGETGVVVQPRPATPLQAGSGSLTITVSDSMAPLEVEWRALERDRLISLHQSFGWCAAWVETYRPTLAILRASIGSEVAFILPLEIVRSHGVRTARFIGAPRSNINTGLFSAKFLADVTPLSAAIQAAIAVALRGHADLLLLSNLPLEWRGRVSPLASLPSVENQNRAFQLPLLGSFEETLSQVNAKRRRKKHRSQTKLLNEIGGFEHVVATTPEEKRQMLDLFLQQKAERFRAAGLPDVFQGSDARDFLLRLLAMKNIDGDSIALELHAIRLKGRHDGHLPAIAALSRKGDHVICQFASIDESVVPEASPGELLFWVMIEKCQESGVALFDFGIGDQLYKRSWCPVQTVQHDILLPVSPLGRVAAFGQRSMTRAKALIKGNPRLYGAIQELRARRQRATTPDEA
ncbi:GNAT family N-acetyltransferase [Rhizobium tumorigenes]|uniref:GNAT family N-acetyltransferase n=1 Tax=Rhizobium tumorigenes TaxID=2041385 RepID=UPI00241C8148|nr:GNAT family N-acetyltransferase [Rhizobium tumorigenes]WFS01957.1 GNAT family N-acetyltransferase [Rhizobium tumorigenes]